MAILFLFLTTPAFASGNDLGGYTFLNISGPDARAVVKTPNGEKKLVAPGDVLGDATITEIVADRIVMERDDEDGGALLIVKIKDGRQQISCLKKMPQQKKNIPVDSNNMTKQSSH